MILDGRQQFNGLVLVGGASSRMGRDKARLKYYDKEHALYLVDQLRGYCSEIYVSGKSDERLDGVETLVDQFNFNGPGNGILSAIKKDSSRPWIVLACDLPFITRSTIKKLVEERDPSCLATAYAVTNSELPEPLVAIWETQAYEVALDQMDLAKRPRKFLMKQKIKIIHPQDDLELMNANYPEEYKEALDLIQQ